MDKYKENKRPITLYAVFETKEEEGRGIKKIKDYCKKHQLNYFALNNKEESLNHYFSIEGNTEKCNKLIDELSDTLINICVHTTNITNICNTEDGDIEFFYEIKALVKSLMTQFDNLKESNKDLSNIVKRTKNADTLLEIKKCYYPYLTKHQLRMIDTRIHVLSTGNMKDIKEEADELISSLFNDVSALRAASNMNRRQFSEYFKIPYRTVEDWERGQSACSTYLFSLMKQNLIDHDLIDINVYNYLISKLDNPINKV